MLELGWQPSEIYFGQGNNEEGLDVWGDFFLQELQSRFIGDSSAKKPLKDAAESLDRGKGYVFKGYAWLEEQLFGN